MGHMQFAILVICLVPYMVDAMQAHLPYACQRADVHICTHSFFGQTGNTKNTCSLLDVARFSRNEHFQEKSQSHIFYSDLNTCKWTVPASVPIGPPAKGPTRVSHGAFPDNGITATLNLCPDRTSEDGTSLKEVHGCTCVAWP